MHLTIFDFKKKEENKIPAKDRKIIPSNLLSHL